MDKVEEQSGTIIKGFFFDLDGTLINTHGANLSAYESASKEVIPHLKPEVDMGELIKKGYSSRDFLRMVYPAITDTELDAVNETKRKHYPKYMHNTQANEFLLRFIDNMSPGAVIALVTTAKKENALTVLRHHNIENIFDCIVFGDDVRSMKPDPEAYQLALEKTGLVADEVIAFEDSLKGEAAAIGAGINVIRIRNFL